MDKIELRWECETSNCGATARIYLPVVKYGKKLELICKRCGKVITLTPAKPAEVEPDPVEPRIGIMVDEERLAGFPPELHGDIVAYMNALAESSAVGAVVARIKAAGFSVIHHVTVVRVSRPGVPEEVPELEPEQEVQPESDSEQEVEERSEPEPLRGFWVIGKDPNIH